MEYALVTKNYGQGGNAVILPVTHCTPMAADDRTQPYSVLKIIQSGLGDDFGVLLQNYIRQEKKEVQSGGILPEAESLELVNWNCYKTLSRLQQPTEGTVVDFLVRALISGTEKSGLVKRQSTVFRIRYILDMRPCHQRVVGPLIWLNHRMPEDPIMSAYWVETNEYLLPILWAEDYERIAHEMLDCYFPENRRTLSGDAAIVDAEELAKRMGLSIMEVHFADRTIMGQVYYDYGTIELVDAYYVKNTHTPIIDRHTFRQVQRIMELKDPHGEYSRYPYYDTNFICPICGKRMTPQVMHTQVKKRAICCFGEDGCQGYSIKTYLVDAALLEAYNSLEMKGCKKSAAWKRMQEIKAESPKMESVQYYWLDDLVERVEFRGDEMCVFWKCGLESEVPLNIPKSEEPTHVAELYRSFLGRLQSGDYRPARPNSTRERMLAEAVHGQQNHAVREAERKGKRPTDLHRASAMRAAQNLKIKRMKGSAVSDR